MCYNYLNCLAAGLFPPGNHFKELLNIIKKGK